jgi:hypothetical protein
MQGSGPWNPYYADRRPMTRVRRWPSRANPDARNAAVLIGALVLAVVVIAVVVAIAR